MYKLVSLLHRTELLTRQVPLAGASLVIAEVFYKFHSFALEAVAFLATWYALDALVGVWWNPEAHPSRQTPVPGPEPEEGP